MLVFPETVERCSDGTRPGYYFSPGSGEGRHKWIVYLNGNSEPEITLPLPAAFAPAGELTFGGCGERESNWEGRLDEIAVFDRVLSGEEIRRLSGAAQ